MSIPRYQVYRNGEITAVVDGIGNRKDDLSALAVANQSAVGGGRIVPCDGQAADVWREGGCLNYKPAQITLVKGKGACQLCGRRAAHNGQPRFGHLTECHAAGLPSGTADGDGDCWLCDDCRRALGVESQESESGYDDL